jgi:predicted  nucleic acid-binding Zn-ribbon protein
MQWIVMAAIGIYAWFVGRLSASAKDVTDLRLRVAQVEEHLKHIPSPDQITELHGQLQKLDAETRSNNNELRGIRESVNIISKYLLENK